MAGRKTGCLVERGEEGSALMFVMSGHCLVNLPTDNYINFWGQNAYFWCSDLVKQIRSAWEMTSEYCDLYGLDYENVFAVVDHSSTRPCYIV